MVQWFTENRHEYPVYNSTKICTGSAKTAIRVGQNGVQGFFGKLWYIIIYSWVVYEICIKILFLRLKRTACGFWSCVLYRFCDHDHDHIGSFNYVLYKPFWIIINITIDESHRKTKFPVILMKFDIRNPFFEPHLSHNFIILNHFGPFLIILDHFTSFLDRIGSWLI